MKFISFIASTMMIVLISQHSIMGLPAGNKVVKNSCSQGFELISGRCVPITSELNKNEMESSSVPSDDLFNHEGKPVGQAHESLIVTMCPEGMKRNKHGICQEIKLSDPTEVVVEATTDLMEKPRGDENLRSCPEGAEHDEQGSCQEINPTKPVKTLIDPKVLLEKNGDCPSNLLKVLNLCLYKKPKAKSAYGDNVPSDMQLKGGDQESGKVGLTNVLPDNSCPEGTEYKGVGVCQKRIRLPNSHVPMKPDGSCPDDYEFVNDKCTHKNSMTQVNSGLTKPTKKHTHATRIEEPVSYVKPLLQPPSHGLPAPGEEEPDI